MEMNGNLVRWNKDMTASSIATTLPETDNTTRKKEQGCLNELLPGSVSTYQSKKLRAKGKHWQEHSVPGVPTPIVSPSEISEQPML